MSLTLVTMDNVHELIPSFIENNKIMIGSYEDISEVILQMIRAKYFFSMDKNILRGCLEDLTYMYCPGDDVNKDRVMSMLEPSDEEESDSDEEEDFNQLDFLKQMMGGMQAMSNPMPPKTQERNSEDVEDVEDVGDVGNVD
jgi:hypothetical protein